MIIQIRHKLTVTRNPTEHGFSLEDKKGELIQITGDGYYLLRFDDMRIRKDFKVNGRKTFKLVPLEWYIWYDDLVITSRFLGS